MRQRAEFRFAALAVAALAAAGCSSSGRSLDLGTADRAPNSAELSGLGRTQLVGLLGPADFNRVDGPAEILQYRNGTCTLDVFLYDKGSGGETRVTHVEARDANMDAVSEDTCLRSVVGGPRPRTS
jgi:hypothetical protein